MELLTHVPVMARFGHALSDPTRVRLLLALRDGPGYPAELAELLEFHGRACPIISAVCGAAAWSSPSMRAGGPATNWPMPGWVTP